MPKIVIEKKDSLMPQYEPTTYSVEILHDKNEEPMPQKEVLSFMNHAAKALNEKWVEIFNNWENQSDKKRHCLRVDLFDNSTISEQYYWLEKIQI